VAFAADGTVEAADLEDSRGWFLGVQWHPEDTVDTDSVQLGLFAALVAAARERVGVA
jgi:putative glutamine amidotransferase